MNDRSLLKASIALNFAGWASLGAREAYRWRKGQRRSTALHDAHERATRGERFTIVGPTQTKGSTDDL